MAIIFSNAKPLLISTISIKFELLGIVTVSFIVYQSFIFHYLTSVDNTNVI